MKKPTTPTTRYEWNMNNKIEINVKLNKHKPTVDLYNFINTSNSTQSKTLAMH